MAATPQVEAANWLMLQGTERICRKSCQGSGVLAADLYIDERLGSGSGSGSGSVDRGAAQFNNQSPHLSTNKGFDIRRARTGIRGQGFPLDTKVNYFFSC